MPRQAKQKCAERMRYLNEIVDEDNFIHERDFSTTARSTTPIPAEKFDEHVKNELKAVGLDDAPYTHKILFNNKSLMQLQKIVSHPYLLRYPYNEDLQPVMDTNFVQCSGKMMMLDALLERLKTQGHKVS